jgi:hypothetical protein
VTGLLSFLDIVTNASQLFIVGKCALVPRTAHFQPIHTPSQTKPDNIVAGFGSFPGGENLHLSVATQTIGAPGSIPPVVVITANNSVKVVAKTAATADLK